MNDLLPLVLEYGYVVLFAFVSAEQIGLPIPAVPVLLGVGALAGAGREQAQGQARSHHRPASASKRLASS